MRRGRIAFLAVLSACVLGAAARAEVIRHPIPNSTFPIAQAVEVRGNVTTYYVSGQVPPVVNKDADPSTSAAYGDTKTQTIGVLTRIKGILEGFGLSMGDVVKMQVFLVHARRPDGLQGVHGGLHAVFWRQPAQSAGTLGGRRGLACQSRFSGRDRGDRREGCEITLSDALPSTGSEACRKARRLS